MKWIIVSSLLVVVVSVLVFGMPAFFGQKEDVVEKALFVVSDTNPPRDTHISERNKLQVFRDIVSSYWDAAVDIVNYEEFVADRIDVYNVLFVINLDDSPLPEEISAAIHSFPGKVVVIGYNFFAATEKDMIANVEHLSRQDIRFSYKGEYIFPLATLTEDVIMGEGDTKKLAFAVTGEGDSFPVAVSLGDRLLVSLRLPNYYETDSHTTVFLSVLEEILGCGALCTKTDRLALLRLEDVNPFTYQDTEHLRKVLTYLESKQARVSIALIPRYVNPPQDIEIDLSESAELVGLLDEYLKGGNISLVQHGYTHQTGTEESAVGFEFWDIEKDAPLEHDSEEFVRERVRLGKEEIKASGLPVPHIWETPHYALSQLDDEVIKSIYPVRYERTSEFGSLPFMITRQYGDGSEVTFIPENLNYISEEGDIVRIKKELEQLSVIRGAIPSLFWHPWRNAAEIEEVIQIFTEEGYKFITAEELIQKI